jgi:hypothetical protein
MKGTMLVIAPGADPVATDFAGPPDLPALQKAVGGYIEAVPYFNAINYRGKWRRCVAFCDEDGKRKQLPYNALAHLCWDVALRQLPQFKKQPADERPSSPDYLVGPVVVLFGDDEWMAEL